MDLIGTLSRGFRHRVGVAQLVLALAVNVTDKGFGAFQAEDKLLVFDKERIDTLRIEDGREGVLLRKVMTILRTMTD